MKNITLCLLIIFGFFNVQAQELLKTNKLPEVAIQGAGDTTLLLIPCMSCRWNEWEEFMARHEDKFKMYAVTFPGYGGTPAPDLPKNTEGTPFRDYILAGLSELIEEQKMENVVIVGHSWGTMVGIQAAAQNNKKVIKVISVDGTIESTSWVPDNKEEQLAQANSVIETYGPQLAEADAWAKFNGLGSLAKKETFTREEVLQQLKLKGSFMATDRSTMLQNWRENMLTNLTAALHKIAVPILDIQSFSGSKQSDQKASHLSDLQSAGAPENVQNVFMYDTKHFIMYHRPEALDCMILDFIYGKPVGDFAPEESEYFEEVGMN